MPKSPSQTPIPIDATPEWHTLTPEATAQRLQTSAAGLTAVEAQARLERYGSNQLPEPRRRGWFMRLLAQFHNILLYVMMGAALITALLGHWVDTGVLFGAVLINALIGFIQEGKAERALEAIRTMLSQHATVVRDGQRYEVDAAALVPGDVVLLASGDRVPADLRLVEVRDLLAEEAALTGESVPSEKSTAATADDTPLGDRHGMAFSGTLAVYGQARGIVVATGAATELGRINQMLSHVETMTTPLLQQIDRFGRALAFVIIGLSVILFFLGTWTRGIAAADMFMMVIALTASAIPEGLPAIMTVTLALGVRRMARRNAIVRRLPSVETLGSVTVICTDKTGTLTRNEMTVQRVVCADVRADVSGVGYAPTGTFQVDGKTLAPDAHTPLAMSMRAALLCNDAVLREEDGAWHVEGDPTEGALLVLASKAGLSQEGGKTDWPRTGAIPFESENRYMATSHRSPEGTPWIFVKGAPERILDMCASQAGGADGVNQALDPDYWRRMSNDIAAHGLRVLALAGKQAAPAGARLSAEDVSSGLTLFALVGMMDPPREEAIAAVAECHTAGISVKMITGDHAETARVIGAQLGIGIGKPAMTGTEIEVLDDAALRRVVMDVDVFARASPEHKLRLVQALQAGNQVVAMTGDGLNDAPALKRADVGVAMGLKGTEAAKEASDMVLADDNFATIAKAVNEGRTVYDNLKKFILFMLPTNGGEALIIIVAILFGLTLPLTPAQVLWINLATSSSLGLALAFEPGEPGIMQRAPRPPGQPLLSGFFVWRVTLVSVLMMTGALGLFLWETHAGTSIEAARTMAVNAVVAAEMFYLINSRSLFRSVLNLEGLFGNRYVLLSLAACLMLQLAYTYAPVMNSIFGSTPLGAADWGKVALAGLLVFFVAELEKAILRLTPMGQRIRQRASW